MSKLLVLMMLVGVVSCSRTVDSEMWRVAQEACSANGGVYYVSVSDYRMGVKCTNKAEFVFTYATDAWKRL